MAIPAEKFGRFAGRRKGRPLRQGRAGLLQDVEEILSIPATVMEQTRIDPQEFFDHPLQKLWIEIGFGNGEHLVGQALNNPDTGFIGCEPFVNGVSMAAKDIAAQDITNIRIWPDEALAFLDKWPDESVDRIFLLFSDPWPKTRQHKRRVIQPESVALFARLLQPGGELRIATDHRHLADWMLLHVIQNPQLRWVNAQSGEWMTPPDDWVETRYQQKAAQQGRPAYFMNFKKT